MTTRRGFLKKTLGGAALLAAAGAVPVALRKTQLREPRGKLRFFTVAEYSVFAAMADRVLARGPVAGLPPELVNAIAARPAAPEPAEVDVAGDADDFLAPLVPARAQEWTQLLRLYDVAMLYLILG